MGEFPRTNVGDLSLSRLVVGTNWMLGYSHCTSSQDNLIRQMHADHKAMADVIEVFFKAGVDTVVGLFTDRLFDAVREAEQRTGVGGIIISTPNFPLTAETLTRGWDEAGCQKVLDQEVKNGVHFTLPHTGTTDQLVDRCQGKIRMMPELCKMIRERGLRPGLSTHLPESIIMADQNELDVDTYISIFNLMGFLMPIEVDWINRVILNAKKPVLTIKPLAAGQIRPLQGLTFSWNAIREQDMVAVGTKTPMEAEEIIEMSLSILEKRNSRIKLQETRSKASVKSANR